MKVSLSALNTVICGMPGLLAYPQYSESKPNIVFIMADDLGWGDTGFNGNNQIKTPCLDALAAEGIIFDRFYSGCAVSSPARAGLLTGRNPFRMGVFNANVGILRPEEVTLPELMKEKGYMTGLFGKWHLGTLTYSETDANRGRIGNRQLYNIPIEHGFDVSFVTESKVPTYDPMKQPVINNGRFWDCIKEGEQSIAYGTSYWFQNGFKSIENLDGDDSRVIIDRVFPFIKYATANNKPFLSMIWFHAPHLPCVAGTKYTDLYPQVSVEERNYYGCISALDEQVGRLVTYLKDNGIYENTILCFCSDNGPEEQTPGTASYLRGRKRSLYEGGIRVPAFVVWKGKLLSGKRTLHPCSVYDVLPTFTELLALETSPYLLDGESLLPVLMQDMQRERPMVFCYQEQGAVIDEKYKLYYQNGKYELYDISADSGETKNLVEQNPQETNRLIAILNSQLESFKASFDGKEYGVLSVERMNQNWHSIKQNEDSHVNRME
jgi:arylsulfatase A-like enzyme